MILMGYSTVIQVLYPPKPKKVAQAEADKKGEAKADPAKDPEDKKGKKTDPDKTDPDKTDPDKAAPAKKSDPEKTDPEKTDPAKRPQTPEPSAQWITLGSIDAESPFRMLVTLTSAGAAVERIELAKFRDTEKEGGYLGELQAADPPDKAREGALVQAVGHGTPAALAGLRPGDVLSSIDGVKIDTPQALTAFLKAKTRPLQKIELGVVRAQNPLTLSATLTRHPLEVIRPEPDRLNPPSLQVSLEKIGTRVRKAGDPEFNDAKLQWRRWELVSPDAAAIAEGKPVTEAVFKAPLPQGLEIYKRYFLSPVKPADGDKVGEADGDKAANTAVQMGYDLDFEIEIRNPADNAETEARSVAYRLHGPNGLPTEGWWYAAKVSGVLRDYVQYFYNSDGSVAAQKVFSATQVADSAVDRPEQSQPLYAVGVDAQYFSAFVFPHSGHDTLWYNAVEAVPLGRIDPNHKNLTNTSVQLTSREYSLPPGKSFTHKLTLFAGPKSPEVLAPHKLGALIDYGWFGAIAVVMTGILHFFYGLVGNYGLAIIMLTATVRICLYPFSRKQAISAEKMKAIQPEMEKIKEKYKNKDEAARAQMELFRKHDVNPFGGCGMLFLQLPIFIGLYRGLQADISLRDAPLFGENFWCSNLAAPDMLFKWEGWFPFLVAQDGQLGPYFNLLPLVTIALYLVQNKMLMPPAQNEQQEMQQKMMNYMMVFMGFMFFKVASGLCVYFIASTIWSLMERKLLPKILPVKAATAGDGAGSGGASPPDGGSGGSPKPPSGGSPKPASGGSTKASAFWPFGGTPPEKDKRDRGNRRKQKGRK